MHVVVVLLNLQLVGFDSASLGWIDTMEFLTYLIPLRNQIIVWSIDVFVAQ